MHALPSRVLTLAIETSNPSAVPNAGAGVGVLGPRPGVALGEVPRAGGALRVLGVEALRDRAAHDDDLMPAIDRLCRRCGVRARELQRVAVSVGPGGFTAVRVAIAAAKMIAEAVGARCVPVPSASVAVRRAPRPCAVALASKGDDAFVTVFDAAGLPVGPGRLVTSRELVAIDVPVVVADRYLPASARSEIERRAVLGWAGPGPARVVEPVFDPAACLEASAWSEEIDPVRLVPIYPREPEAVRKWRELHGAPPPPPIV